MIVVGLSGVAQAGKDTAADALVRQLGFVKRGYAEALREGALNINPPVAWNLETDTPIRYADVLNQFGYEKGKTQYPLFREFLQNYGTGGARMIFGEDIWIDTLFAWAEAQGVERLVVPDVRFPNEVQGVADRYGLVFRVVRTGMKPVNDHISDNALTDDDFDPSMRIVNNREMQDLQRATVRAVANAFGL